MTSSKKLLRQNVYYTLVNISGKFHEYFIYSLEVIKGGPKSYKGGAESPPPPTLFNAKKAHPYYG